MPKIGVCQKTKGVCVQQERERERERVERRKKMKTSANVIVYFNGDLLNTNESEICM